MAQSDHAHCTKIERGQIVPVFSLPGADSMVYSPWNYKQRDNLLLLFTQSTKTAAGRELLRSLAHHYADFRDEKCVIIAITADPVIVNLQVTEELHLPFPLVADVAGTTIERYTDWDAATHMLLPSMVLTDRYGACYEQWNTRSEAELPPLQEILKTLQYLNSICTP
ncbi:MAG TPA: redoxin domain-containing protein [Ktedonobacteraceae bacterium]|nr:redoxin domain-containing protein [Ktedonobacteraceae bacterium]